MGRTCGTYGGEENVIFKLSMATTRGCVGVNLSCFA